MGKLAKAIAVTLVAAMLLMGCGPAKPQDKGAVPQKPAEVVYGGNIFASSGNALSVYVYDGYRGVLVVHVTDKTKIDETLRSKLKAGTYIAFVTDATLLKSEPPQTNAVTIKSAVEGILVRGKAITVKDGVVTVETASPRTGTLVVRTTNRTVTTTGVESKIIVGSALEFETAPVMLLSEPPQVEMIRLLKNGVSGVVPPEVTKIAGRPVSAVLNRSIRDITVKSGATIATDMEEDMSVGRWFTEVSREQVFKYVTQGTYGDAAGKTHSVSVSQPVKTGEYFLYMGLNSTQNKVLERLVFRVFVEGPGTGDLREYEGTYLGLQDGFISVQTESGVQTVYTTDPGMVKEFTKGDRVVVVASLGEAVQRLEMIRKLSSGEYIHGSFVKIQRITALDMQVVQLDTKLQTINRGSVSLPAGFAVGSSAYVEYKMSGDSDTDSRWLRKIELVKW